MEFAAYRVVRWFTLAIILVSSIGCDQVTKSLARAQLRGEPARSYCGDLVRLEYAENPGAFLSLGSQLPESARWILLIVVNGLMMTGIAIALVWRWNMSALQFVACALLLSGGVGNMIDRLRFDGLVIDYLNMGVGPLRTGIFNVADVAITAGALLLVFGGREVKNEVSDSAELS